MGQNCVDLMSVNLPSPLLVPNCPRINICSVCFLTSSPQHMILVVRRFNRDVHRYKQHASMLFTNTTQTLNLGKLNACNILQHIHTLFISSTGCIKKMVHSDFSLKSIPVVGFYLFRGVLDPEFCA